ncbi:peptide methionine sulfoxide reductase msrB [Coemansia reversa NRRL 1564]|uniref:Peptide-methionine (R)-S-oxide reductase n=1 Tax=Coemansia reversa (strain ATCC 12441 / NRRL 1564) TaxID=763665 RepID=A0A2G5BGS3_COERN|nr:peptide methionine sulfoxide reductase msrB [Coemansia reversa NRRL 1564]|eukprot:PIA18210.1 peptide methionine sulfoxide reductase msrB [Coemansia reversa NRRL 1564]
MSFNRSDDEWRAVLSPQQFAVLRQKATEPPGSGEYTKKHDAGLYTCGACAAPLYSSSTKFDAHCGWPAFYKALPGAIRRIEDRSLGMARTEIVCAKCSSHLGHVFRGEGFRTPTDERHCVNSISLKFTSKS